VAGGAGAAAADDSATELAKKTQNPVADLISVPFQGNFNFNAGDKDATVYVLNDTSGRSRAGARRTRTRPSSSPS